MVRTPFPGFTDPAHPTRREVAPERILEAFYGVLRQLLAAEPKARGIFFSTQMHGVVMVDENGNARSPYISWQDQRALEPVEAAPQDGNDGNASSRRTFYDEILAHAGVFREDAGNELRAALPLGTLFVNHRRGDLPANCYPVSLTDFIAAHLRKAAPKADFCNAASTGMTDLRARRWHAPMIEALGLTDAVRWPEIVESGALLGEAEFEGRRFDVYAGVGDQQAALLGSNLREDELSLNVATGSQVSRILRELEVGLVQTRPYSKGRWLRTVTHLPSGRSLNALLAAFTQLHRDGARMADAAADAALWEQVIAAVKTVPASDVRVNLAFFPSAVGDRGALENLHTGNLNVGAIFRAAFVSMAQTYETVAGRLWPQRDWRSLVFSGGLLAKLEPLRDEVTRRLGKVYRSCESREDALEGLLVLAEASSR